MPTTHKLEEALSVAEEARQNAYLGRYPSACVILADEVASLNSSLTRLTQERDELLKKIQP